MKICTKLNVYGKALLLAAIAMLYNTTASATLLSTDGLTKNGGILAIPTYIDYEFGYGSNFNITTHIFDLTGLTNSDQGSTFSLNSGSNFNTAVSFLTNGNNTDTMVDGYLYGPGGGGGGSMLAESIFIPNAVSIDFNVWDITAFELTINTLTLVSPGSNTPFLEKPN